MDYKSTILIVDDEEVGRENLEDMLVKQGYSLIFAADGPECLTKAAETPPDVILLDVMMPGMDGFEVCRRLRSHPLLAEVPIIMVTALDDRAARLTGIEAGADDFISKPLDRVELRARLQTITRLNRYRRLLSQRARFTWVTERADDAYLILNRQGEIQYANAQARSYLNLPQNDEPVNGNFLTIAQSQYRCAPPEAWETWPHLPDGPTRPLEMARDPQGARYLLRPETIIHESAWLQVDQMEAGNQMPDGYLVRLHDVTAQIIEERLQWTFHAQVSHKLKTPLTHLMGGVELLMNDAAHLTEEQKQSFLALVHQASNQLEQTLHSIFEYVESIDMTYPERGSCTIAKILSTITHIEQALAAVTISATLKNIRNPDQVSVAVSGRAMEMILGQLIENAQKFHPNHSPNLVIGIDQVPQGIRLQICDDGLTLPDDHLSKIWTPYYQAEKYFTGQVKGVGLGLSMVAAIILGVGGACRAYNRADETSDGEAGLVIELIIPAMPATGKSQSAGDQS